MSTLTKEQWAELEKKLNYPWDSAKLLIDGYNITLIVHFLKALRMEICVYVDGYLKVEYVTHDCEERRRFYRATIRDIMPVKMRKQSEKIRKKLGLEPTTYTTYSWGWTSFAALRRHLIKNNESIELKAGAA
ncbi:MAG: hypothetical protein M0R70_12750 [Nitrospirae bacterium]|nr:hypothetical protein [Nitrospirota bacterium]